MSNSIDYREGELPTPEGYPSCPICSEYVSLEEGNPDYYLCRECNYYFPLEEAR